MHLHLTLCELAQTDLHFQRLSSYNLKALYKWYYYHYFLAAQRS